MTDTPTSIRLKDLHKRITAGQHIELIDVRTQPEYDAEHVACARLLPLDQLDAKAFLGQRSDKTQPLYVLCQSGGRAARAIEKFRKAGFDRCVHVEGGTQAWIDAGLPVERGETRVLPLSRQVQIIIGTCTAAGAALALWVHPAFAWIALMMGCGVLMAGATGYCPLAMAVARLPWNRKAACESKSCCTVAS